MVLTRKKFKSDICIDGKRISEMREIAKAHFGEAFFHIDIKDGRFCIYIYHSKTSSKEIKRFTDNPKHKLCRILPHELKPLEEICPQCR